MKKTVKDFEVLAFCKVLDITLNDLYSDTDKYYEAQPNKPKTLSKRFFIVY